MDVNKDKWHNKKYENPNIWVIDDIMFEMENDVLKLEWAWN